MMRMRLGNRRHALLRIDVHITKRSSTLRICDAASRGLLDCARGCRFFNTARIVCCRCSGCAALYAWLLRLVIKKPVLLNLAMEDERQSPTVLAFIAQRK